MAVKNVSDVTINLNITSLPTTGTAKIAILTSGSDSNAHAYTFNAINGVENNFDENSNVYNLVDKAFKTDGFNGQVEVIVAPSADVSTGTTATAQPGANGATVTAASNTVNRFVFALKQHIDDGFNYVTDDNLGESDLEAVSDYLYKTQSAAFLTQVSSVSQYQTFEAYVAKNQPKTENKLSGAAAFTVTGPYKPVVQLIAKAAQINLDSGGIDIMKIGNLSEFVPDDGLTREDLAQLKSLRGNAIVDKADMAMPLTGYAIGDNYLDEFVNTKIAKDYFQYKLQRALNDMKTRSYDQTTINFLYSIAKQAGDDLVARNILAAAPVIDKTDFANVTSDAVENRYYNGFNISGQISGSVESMTFPINFAE
ncbi:hypothetical protein [Apilactobacillus nanyangensis]|uniref:hypothetical protein n=1 Tax=Apilactobacillus nanyangensis TaxID=2799579 RepID=UPI0019443A4A|nr:hypothetical protein [Apilactobacillus nanyangensis]